MSLFFFHPTDPEQLFVEPHHTTPYILGIYRHETSLVIPCRTTSPDTVVTLTGVRPHRDKHFILSAVWSPTEYYSTELVVQDLSSIRKISKKARPLLIPRQDILAYYFRQFVLQASHWFSHPLCGKSIEHTETDQGQWRVWGKPKWLRGESFCLLPVPAGRCSKTVLLRIDSGTKFSPSLQTSGNAEEKHWEETTGNLSCRLWLLMPG